MKFIALNDSHRLAPQGTKVSKVAGNKRLQVSIMLPCRTADEKIDKLVAEVTSGKRKPLSVGQLAQVLGAAKGSYRKVTDAAAKHGLTIVAQSTADRAHGIVKIAGTYARFQKFFPGLELHVYEENGVKFIGREGAINVAESLPLIGIYGFDKRDVAHTNYRFATESKSLGETLVHVSARIPSGLTSRGLARLQGVPVDELSKRTDIVTGYISLGGDNGKRMQADVASAAKHDGINTAKFVGVSVDGTPIEGDYNDGATVENALDAQAHALMNPNGTVVIFRADNSDDAFAHAQEVANVFEGVKVGGKTLPLMGVSISWGMAETAWTEQSLKRWERAFKAARLRGLIVTSATGDNGSKDSTKSDTPDAPSCVPGNIGAAGVYIRSTDGKTVTEIGVWNDGFGGGATGGGISAIFAPMQEESGLGLPVSKTTKKPGHNASLIADCAAPDSGPQVFYRGRFSQVGGTSHSAPFINIKLAFLKAILGFTDAITFTYGNHAGKFRQVTVAGNNDAYDAKPGDVINVPVGFGVIDWAGWTSKKAAVAA